MRLEVPDSLQRNHPCVAQRGYENTGQTLLELIAHRTGFSTLGDVDVLDVGCGVRFTQAIVNRGIPIKSYTGIEVSAPIVDFLTREVSAHDSRFRYVHWNVANTMYNLEGEALSEHAGLPVAERFDLIVLYSVFTHLSDQDARALLTILRRHVRPAGKLFFSAFVDDGIDGFEDRDPAHPLLLAYFGRRYLRDLAEAAGWTVDAEYAWDPTAAVQHHFVCSPAAAPNALAPR